MFETWRRGPLWGRSPSRAQWSELLSRLRRVRVFDTGTADGELVRWQGQGEPTLLLDLRDPEGLQQLREALDIVEDPKTFGRCLCLGGPALELLGDGEDVLALLGLHHGHSIRWDRWKYDAVLQDGPKLLRWLSDRGIPGPLEEFETNQRRQASFQEHAKRWQEAAPDGLEPLHRQLLEDPENLAPVREALEARFPSSQERILELLRWFGSGMGPWSGYPSYESLPENLLSESLDTFLPTVETQSLGSAHLEGAARFLAALRPTRRRRRVVGKLSPALRERLLAHCLQSPDLDKVRRACKTFQDEPRRHGSPSP